VGGKYYFVMNSIKYTYLRRISKRVSMEGRRDSLADFDTYVSMRNINVYFKEIGYEIVDWIHPAWDRFRWPDLEKKKMNLDFLERCDISSSPEGQPTSPIGFCSMEFVD
jgi:hypothetical protein